MFRATCLHNSFPNGIKPLRSHRSVNWNTGRPPRTHSREDKLPIRYHDFAAAHIWVPRELVILRQHTKACTKYSNQSFFLTKCDAPGPRTLSGAATGKGFGPCKRMRTDNGNEEVAHEKTINERPLMSAHTTLSSVGRKTMRGRMPGMDTANK